VAGQLTKLNFEWCTSGTRAGATVGDSQENDGLDARPEQRLGNAQMKVDDGDLREEDLGDILA
jgi:hypothetical protein